jgi:hypothetical protein
MLSKHEEMAERRRVLANDARVREQQREQGSTYLDQYHSDLGGRYVQIQPENVIGSTAIPQYPQASTPFQRDPVPPENPLGYRIDELERGSFSPAQKAPELRPEVQGETSAPVPDVPSSKPLVGDVERGTGARPSRTYRRY